MSDAKNTICLIFLLQEHSLSKLFARPDLSIAMFREVSGMGLANSASLRRRDPRRRSHATGGLRRVKVILEETRKSTYALVPLRGIVTGVNAASIWFAIN